jgi:hypothetical protein
MIVDEYRYIGHCHWCECRIVSDLDGGPDPAAGGDMTHYCCRYPPLPPEELIECRTPEEIEQDRLEPYLDPNYAEEAFGMPWLLAGAPMSEPWLDKQVPRVAENPSDDFSTFIEAVIDLLTRAGIATIILNSTGSGDSDADGEHVAELPAIGLEQIGDELFPYFADDERAAHLGDGRLAPED